MRSSGSSGTELAAVGPRPGRVTRRVEARCPAAKRGSRLAMTCASGPVLGARQPGAEHHAQLAVDVPPVATAKAAVVALAVGGDDGLHGLVVVTYRAARAVRVTEPDVGGAQG